MNYQQQQQQQQNQQNPNVIKNPQSQTVSQVKGPSMNDRDYLNDLLAMEKYLTDNLNIFAREASHRELHNTVMRILGETHQAARDTFNLMFRKGFYKLEVENPQHVAQTQQQFQNYRSQFPYNPATYT